MRILILIRHKLLSWSNIRFSKIFYTGMCSRERGELAITSWSSRVKNASLTLVIHWLYVPNYWLEDQRKQTPPNKHVKIWISCPLGASMSKDKDSRQTFYAGARKNVVFNAILFLYRRIYHNWLMVGQITLNPHLKPWSDQGWVSKCVPVLGFIPGSITWGNCQVRRKRVNAKSTK